MTWTVRRCIDGTFAAATGTATEDGTTGWYKFAMSQADTNGNNIEFNFTGTGSIPQTVNIITTAADPTDTVRFGLTALPNVASGSAGAIPTTGSGANQIAVNGSGKISGVVLTDTVTTYTGNTVQTGDNFARLGAPAGASIAADLAEIEAETDGIAAISTATPLTAAQIATGVWQDTTAGDFTVALSVGKSVMNGVALGTGLTVANLTNAPTNGDFTATMKTSAQTAADAAITANALVLEIEADTDTLTGFITVAPPTSAAIATAVLTTQLTESYAAVHVVPTLAQAIFEVRGLLAEASVASTTLTVKKVDGSTAAKTYTLSSSTAPTSITNAS